MLGVDEGSCAHGRRELFLHAPDNENENWYHAAVDVYMMRLAEIAIIFPCWLGVGVRQRPRQTPSETLQRSCRRRRNVRTGEKQRTRALPCTQASTASRSRIQRATCASFVVERWPRCCSHHSVSPCRHSSPRKSVFAIGMRGTGTTRSFALACILTALPGQRKVNIALSPMKLLGR